MGKQFPVTRFGSVEPLLDLIERRFSVHMEAGSANHLRDVMEHYQEKRALLLYEHGEAGALANPDYAKAVMISEAARLMILHEVVPRPRTKKSRKKD